MSPHFLLRRSSRRKNWPWLCLSAVIVLVDQLTKLWIVERYQWGEFTPIWSFFNLVRWHNTGAAFSFLADGAVWQRSLLTGVALVAVGVILWLLLRIDNAADASPVSGAIGTHHPQHYFFLALALILGGAIGNLIDRIRFGYVVDFLDFHLSGIHFPAFNVADSAITCGAFFLILDELLRLRRASKKR